MAKMDIHAVAPGDPIQHQVVIVRKPDVGPEEISVVFCANEIEASVALVHAVKNTPPGHSCTAYMGPIHWKAEANKP